MRRLRLAVIIDQHVSIGGGFQQALNAILNTKDLPLDLVESIYFTTIQENVNTLKNYKLNCKYINLSFLDKLIIFLRVKFFGPRTLTVFKIFQKNNSFENVLLKHNIDLVYFVSPSDLAQSLEEINYIITVWDLCHRDQPEFPEVRLNRKIHSRDYHYKYVLPRAIAILVDSNLGKQNIIKRYGIDEERIYVIPFQASIATQLYKDFNGTNKNILINYNITSPYIFYPAQFWAHKNHVYILEGLKILQDSYGIDLEAVFSGGDVGGNLNYIKSYVKSLNLENRIRFVGFVPDDIIPILYKHSTALVMPTYFGPTNIPPLEAFQLGVPVLYSNKPGMRDQVGDAGLLLDLKDPQSMAEHLKNLIKNPDLRDKLIKSGYLRISEINSTKRVDILITIVEEFKWKRITYE